ncbi:replication protein O [Burkholderia vietnamiensis]|uniref:replication protein O n=1 Tax=Burkholderia vietnamiensis TaxID=60552 RepID=UPI0015944167|nr:replication protein O [Burkholderia vietnamiensis]
MDIAQSPVAGEGEAHLDAKEHQRSQGCVALQCDVRNLPYQTLRAQQRALSLTDLPQRARAALSAIAQTVDCRKPLASVFARRAYLSKRAGMSERTWYRAENDLVDAGLITVAEQGRKSRVLKVADQGKRFRSGLFGCAYIHLTRDAAVILGLLASPARPQTGKSEAEAEPHEPCAAPGNQHSAPQPQVNAAAADSSALPTATVSDRFTYKDYLSPDSLQKRQQDRLPADVRPLRALGFHENYIFQLMKRARVQHGKRLGEVVQATWDHLSQARRPVAYLLKLLASPTDFGWLARQKAAAIEAQVVAQAEVQQQDAVRKEIAGQLYFSTCGTRRYAVSGDGLVLVTRDVSEAVDRSASSGWISGFTTAFRCGAIVPATAKLETDFAARIAASSAASRRTTREHRLGASLGEVSAMDMSLDACRAQLRRLVAGSGRMSFR